jgi:tRNA(adenine34) deaminase
VLDASAAAPGTTSRGILSPFGAGDNDGKWHSFGGVPGVFVLSRSLHEGRFEACYVAHALASDDDRWMGLALEEADAAAGEGEVPVGCVIVDPAQRVVGRGRNAREAMADPTAHAEMLAVREAAARTLSWRLEGTTAYVTLEPCVMCAGALVHARVARVVYGCSDPKGGAVHTMFGVGLDPRLNHRFEVTPGVRAEECAERLRRFFGKLRAGGSGVS